MLAKKINDEIQRKIFSNVRALTLERTILECTTISFPVKLLLTNCTMNCGARDPLIMAFDLPCFGSDVISYVELVSLF